MDARNHVVCLLSIWNISRYLLPFSIPCCSHRHIIEWQGKEKNVFFFLFKGREYNTNATNISAGIEGQE